MHLDRVVLILRIHARWTCSFPRSESGRNWIVVIFVVPGAPDPSKYISVKKWHTLHTLLTCTIIGLLAENSVQTGIVILFASGGAATSHSICRRFAAFSPLRLYTFPLPLLLFLCFQKVRCCCQIVPQNSISSHNIMCIQTNGKLLFVFHKLKMNNVFYFILIDTRLICNTYKTKKGSKWIESKMEPDKSCSFFHPYSVLEG